MNKLWLIFPALIFHVPSKAQVLSENTKKSYELGLTLLSLNSFDKIAHYGEDRPRLEYLNTLFFRYNEEKYAIRALLSYSTYSYASGLVVNPNASGGLYSQSKDLRAGIGAQYHLLERSELFYGFLDMHYRNKFKTGYIYGDIPGHQLSFSSTISGVDCYLGMGCKVKLFKQVCISTEFSCLSFFGRENYSINNHTIRRSYTSSYDHLVVNPSGKIHLAVCF